MKTKPKNPAPKPYPVVDVKPLTTGGEDLVYNGKKVRQRKLFIVNDRDSAKEWELIMELLVKAVNQKNLPHKVIAEKLNIATPQVSRLVHCHHEPKLGLFLKLAASVDEEFFSKLSSLLLDVAKQYDTTDTV